MQTQEFLDLLFARARAESIEACEVYLGTSDSFQASVNGGEVVEYSVSRSLALGFRVLVNGHFGYASTQVLDEDAICLLIERAKDNALITESKDEQFLYPGDGHYPVVDVYNPALDQVSAADKLQMALTLEKQTLDVDARVTQVDDCVLASSSGEIRIVNSLGLDVSHRDNLLMAYVGAVTKQDELVNSAFDFVVTRDAASLDIEQLAGTAARRSLEGLTARPVPSGSYKVVFTNLAMASLLSAFSPVFSADMAQKGLSLLAGREEEIIAAHAVTLLDDPNHILGWASSPFDAEGVATKKKAVIDKGKLTTLLHNLKTAHKQGVKTTANATKSGASAPIGVAPSNFHFAPGEQSFEQLLEEAGDGLIVSELQGLHVGTDTASGDFSLSAKGYLIESGKQGRAVNQITVSGNFYQLLKDISAVGNDLRFYLPGDSCFGSPALLVSRLSVAGENERSGG